MIFSCREPDVIQLYEGRDGAVVGKATMVIGVEQVVDDEVLEDLVKDSIFYKFTHLWYVGNWAVIFTQIPVTFFVMRVDQLCLPISRELMCRKR